MIYCVVTRISAAMKVSPNTSFFTLYLLICISVTTGQPATTPTSSPVFISGTPSTESFPNPAVATETSPSIQPTVPYEGPAPTPGVNIFGAPDCPVGWIVGFNECYLFHQNPLTWQDAMVYCRSRRAHLAKIETEQERSLIQTIIEQDLPGIYWLGGKDDATEGDWRWQPSNEIVNETFWNHGEPDEFTGNEDCLTTSEMEQGLWNDRACGNYYGFICEQL